RDGVIESVVQTLSSKNPVITLPVKPEYAPNVFVSALLVRGRNAEVAPTALVDLGKPAFKLGIANVKVNWASWRLGVAVTPEKTRYRPRDQAQVNVQVTPPAGQSLPANTEVTIAAVDEALLELAGNDTWDVLTPMMVERGYGMSTATSQLQVVGKRHFGRKALPAGGGGGRGANTRELFDTLVYWQARATVDAGGRAVFTVPLNDSLTGFRLVAAAISPDRFGHGQSRLETFQDLQLISGLPLTVRQGDKLDPGFTLRNATAQAMSLQFVAAVQGMGTLIDRTVVIPGGQSEVVTVPFTVPKDQAELNWSVRADGKGIGDALALTQKVLDPVPERVWQATLLQLTEPVAIPVQKPAGALPGGAVRISGEARLADSIDTVREYFRNYPYSCLEQKTSKAAGLQDRVLWDQLMMLLPAYLDDNGLAAFYPATTGYPFLTAHVLRVSRALDWPIPDSSREKMLTGLVNYVEGRIPFEDWRLRELDDAHRRLEVLSLLATYGRLKPAHLDPLKIDPPRWTTSMLVSWFDVLRHGRGLPRQAERLEQAESLLRSRLTLQGSALLLSDGEYNAWWLYENDAAVIARLMLATMELPAWREDQPRLIRGLLMRQREGHWSTTVANMWGGFALRRFSDAFEREAVSGNTLATLAGQQAALEWTQKVPEPARLDWPVAPASLLLKQQGTGRPWITVQSRARIPLKAPYGTGFTVSKQIVPVQQQVPGRWTVGDVVRVHLTMTAQSDIGWVAIDDPIPSGATLLGRALGRDNSLTADSSGGDWTGATYAEFAADAYRAYYERIYKGEWRASYTVRLNQSGDFVLPPTRVEAMYAPEMFGMTPNDKWVVQP
ncbi:MAG: alpha-2-macroglobulin family protein, partial [Gammaproteobacteria bacterium]